MGKERPSKSASNPRSLIVSFFRFRGFTLKLDNLLYVESSSRVVCMCALRSFSRLRSSSLPCFWVGWVRKLCGRDTRRQSAAAPSKNILSCLFRCARAFGSLLLVKKKGRPASSCSCFFQCRHSSPPTPFSLIPPRAHAHTRRAPPCFFLVLVAQTPIRSTLGYIHRVGSRYRCSH